MMPLARLCFVIGLVGLLSSVVFAEDGFSIIKGKNFISMQHGTMIINTQANLAVLFNQKRDVLLVVGKDSSVQIAHESVELNKGVVRIVSEGNVNACSFDFGRFRIGGEAIVGMLDTGKLVVCVGRLSVLCSSNGEVVVQSGEAPICMLDGDFLDKESSDKIYSEVSDRLRYVPNMLAYKGLLASFAVSANSDGNEDAYSNAHANSENGNSDETGNSSDDEDSGRSGGESLCLDSQGSDVSSADVSDTESHPDIERGKTKIIIKVILEQ